VQVIDFSLAKQVDWKTFTLCGTPEYMAPELLQCAGHSFGVDWWSLGILLYELLVGHTPFQAATAREILRNVLRGDVFVPSYLSAAAKSLIRHLLTADTTRRYGMLRGGAQDVLGHRVRLQVQSVRVYIHV
jgi:serine/threonine protein kinase